MASLQEIGEELFEIVSLAHPELAPKLVGMLLQLGEAECRLCLRSDVKLAARLDEAMAILDQSGIGRGSKPTIVTSERRIDPTDGKARTLEELRKACRGQYNDAEIDDYWRQLKPVGSEVAPAATAPTAAKKPAQSASLQPAPARAEAKAPARQAPPQNAPVQSSTARPEAKAPARQAATTAPANPVPKAKAAREAVPGLKAWLADLQLSKHADAAERWAEDMGACSLDEILENLDDFISDMQFKPLEKNRILKAQGQTPPAAVVPPAVEAPVEAPESEREHGVSYYNETPNVTEAPERMHPEEEDDEDFDAYESYQNDREQCAREMMGLCVDDFASMDMREENTGCPELPTGYPELPKAAASKKSGKRWG